MQTMAFSLILLCFWAFCCYSLSSIIMSKKPIDGTLDDGNAVNEIPKVSISTPKRKREFVEQLGKKSKSLDLEDKKKPSSETKTQELPYNRKSSSYQIAEMKIYRIMIEKDAVVESPMLFSELRSLAEKEIGDSKLTEHILNHIDGTIAPDINDRYRQGQNANGEMVFWVESADLVNDMDMEGAGVNDLSWWFPAGRKYGDRHTIISSQEVYEILMSRKEVVQQEMLEIDEALTKFKAIHPECCSNQDYWYSYPNRDYGYLSFDHLGKHAEPFWRATVRLPVAQPPEQHTNKSAQAL